MAGEDWTREEVEATVADYFGMLASELAGLPVNKRDRNRRLQQLLRGRSAGSVEFKHANISAVLTLHGYPYINGYKPRGNFQSLLEQVVLEYLDVHRDFFDALIAGPVLNPRVTRDVTRGSIMELVADPPERLEVPVPIWSPAARIARIDFV